MLQSFDMVGINLPMIIMTYDYLPSLEVVAPRSLSLPPQPTTTVLPFLPKWAAHDYRVEINYQKFYFVAYTIIKIHHKSREKKEKKNPLCSNGFRRKFANLYSRVARKYILIHVGNNNCVNIRFKKLVLLVGEKWSCSIQVRNIKKRVT